MAFAPRFTYNHQMVANLGTIESARAVVQVLPLPPDTSLQLRHDALERSTRSSTQIEGNPLDRAAILRAIARSDRTGSAAEQEVRNYWRGLDRVEEFAAGDRPISEALIQELHRIIIVRGRGRRGSKSAYRLLECPVVDTVSRRIDYAPPEPGDVPALMKDLVHWLSSPVALSLSAPIRAAILTHRFLSIHPFSDGNGRTGRLLATAELWRSGYRMRGFFSFEEYFNADRARYYNNLQMGLPVDFYQGRHDPDHSAWIAYFLETMAQAAAALQDKAIGLYQQLQPAMMPWEQLPRVQQQVLTRLVSRVKDGSSQPFSIDAGDIAVWFGVSDRTARDWLKEWVASGFLVIKNTGLRVRNYELAQMWIESLFANSGSTSSEIV
jgi:Fic family protein